MRLYHMPGACSQGIHILLEEAGVNYDLSIIDLARGQQLTPEFRAINPKGKVPALLRDDGTLLTEFQAIAFWIARRYPDARLLPADADGECRALELMDYIVATVHMRGYTMARMPKKFTSDEGAEQLRITATLIYAEGVETLSRALGDQPYFLASFTIADAAAFYVLSWADMIGVTLPTNLTAFIERMRRRPAVERALQQVLV
jgi:glutathione S-transferase